MIRLIGLIKINTLIASLLVSLHNVLKIYAEGAADMKKIFINESIYLDQANKPDHQKRVNELE
jgi:hypothetical protein